MKEERPKLHIEWSHMDYVMEALAFTGAVSGVLIAVAHFGELPDRIPIHFDGRGEPNGWGPRAAVWLIPLLGLGLYVMMTFMNRFPHTFNYPVKITAENAEYHYRLTTRLIRFLKTFICVAFALITWHIIAVAKGELAGLPGWFLWVFLAGTILPTFVYFFLISKKKT